MGKEAGGGGVPKGFRAEDLSQQAWLTALSRPPLGLSGARHVAGDEAGPGPLPFTLTWGRVPELPTPQFVPEESGAGREGGVRQADPAGCLVQDHSPPPLDPLPQPCPMGPWVCLYSTPRRQKGDKRPACGILLETPALIDACNRKGPGLLSSKT